MFKKTLAHEASFHKGKAVDTELFFFSILVEILKIMIEFQKVMSKTQKKTITFKLMTIRFPSRTT